MSLLRCLGFSFRGKMGANISPIQVNKRRDKASRCRLCFCFVLFPELETSESPRSRLDTVFCLLLTAALTDDQGRARVSIQGFGHITTERHASRAGRWRALLPSVRSSKGNPRLRTQPRGLGPRPSTSGAAVRDGQMPCHVSHRVTAV